MNQLILITGPSAAGKSTLASELVTRLEGYQVINQDNFCFDRNALLLEYDFFDLNHESPKIVDHDLAYLVLNKLLLGKEAEIPLYVHKELSRDGSITITGSDIIYEGLHAFFDPRLRELARLKVFIETDDSTLLKRRLHRDSVQRGIKNAKEESYFSDVVLGNYKQHVQPLKVEADIVLDGNLNTQEQVRACLNVIGGC